MTDDALVDKVRKLLALAESSNEHEAALAAERAQELMFKYGIELAEVAASRGESIKVDKESIHGKLDPWRRILANSVAKSVGGETVVSRVPRTWRGRIDFWGERGVAQAAAALYQYLEAQVTVISAIAATTRPEEYATAAQSMRWRKSFCMGMVERIDDRLRDRRAKMEVATEGSSTALVVVKSAVERAMDDHYGEDNLSNKSFRVNTDPAAHEDGIGAGDRVDLGDSRLGGNRPELTP